MKKISFLVVMCFCGCLGSFSKKIPELDFYKGNTSSNRSINLEMLNAALAGNIDEVNSTIQRGANNYNAAMEGGAREGHINIVELMLDKGANSYNKTMMKAAKGNHTDIIELMLDKGANNYNETMIISASRGYMNIIKLMRAKGANSYNEAMVSAASKGHISIVKLMLLKGACNFEDVMEVAAKGRYVDIVELMLKKTSTSYQEALFFATETGQEELVDLIIEKLLRTYYHKSMHFKEWYNFIMGYKCYSSWVFKVIDEAFEISVKNGNASLVSLIIRKGRPVFGKRYWLKNSKTSIIAAVQKGDIDVVEVFIEQEWWAKKTDFQHALCNAAEKGHMEIVQLMMCGGNFYEWAKKFSNAIEAAAKGGQINIVNWLSLCDSRGNSSRMIEIGYEKAMCSAAKEGYIEIIKLVVKRAEENYEKKRHTNIDAPYSSSLTKKYKKALVVASSEDHMEVVEHLINHGAYDDKARAILRVKGQHEMVKLINKNSPQTILDSLSNIPMLILDSFFSLASVVMFVLQNPALSVGLVIMTTGVILATIVDEIILKIRRLWR